MAEDSRALLGPNGPLARNMPGYEHRDGQLDMAEAVERALDEDRIVLCEAGTGTGKTLAYLVPALLSGRRVVVSTASKALQEQIVGKDLPLIREHFGLTGNAVLVKGLSNYLCRRRYDELRRSTEPLSGQLREALPLVERWAAETRLGDISEVDELAEAHPIWREITSSSDARIGQQCPHFEECHITHLKRAAEAADVVIANHHLFFADLAIKGEHRGGALPPYDAVILDEAHRLEDVAGHFFGARVSSAGVTRLLRDLERSLRVHRDREQGEPPALLSCAMQCASDLFAALNVALGETAQRPANGGRTPRSCEGRAPLSNEGRTALPAELWSGPLLAEYHAFDNAFEAIEGHLSTLTDATEQPSMQQATRRVAGLRADLATIVEPGDRAVVWLQRSSNGLELSASPVHVGPIMHAKLFAQGNAIILTSASLSTSSGFTFIRSRLGLDPQQPLAAPVDELIVTAALDYQRQALLYTPTDLPDVTELNFLDLAAERIAELKAMTPGGAFVLCTSTRVMQALGRRLAARWTDTTMLQGEAPKAALLSRFRRLGNAVLVATMSFWEGVDVPGNALRLVVIDRLPFAVPTDPIINARCQALNEQGKSAFKDYSLPQAAITLKQGFGRLLRTRDDMGVVAILDRRICTRGYGRTLVTSLPEVRQTRDLEDVAAFWRQHASW